MMATVTHYRLIAPGDGPAMEALVAACADAGTIGFTYDYQRDLLAINAALADDLRGAVAVRDGAVIGMVLGDLRRVQWAGELRRAAYVSDLRVHPDFRRQGVGRGLAEWSIARLEGEVGPDVVMYAAVQEGNVSSALVRQHQFRATDLIEGGVIPMRRTPPAVHAGLQVREAEEKDLPAIAEGMNGFYREHNLWSPVTSAGLQEFLDRQVDGIRPNQLYVVTRGGHVVGGLSLSDRTQLVRMRVAQAPAYVRLLGNLLGVLPRDGVLRALTVRRVWFGEGELEAGRYLWQELCYRLRGRGNCLGIAYDRRDKLAGLFRVPFWLPVVRARYLVRAAGPPGAERPTYCIAGA